MPDTDLDIRKILASAAADGTKIRAIKEVAAYRIKNPPAFTLRDDNVMQLYQDLLDLDINNPESLLGTVRTPNLD